MNPSSPPALTSLTDQELILLDVLKDLLTVAIHALTQGEAQCLLEVGQQIQTRAQELMDLSIQLGGMPIAPEVQLQRRQLLSQLSQQRSFCRAMLRRRRRFFLLRRQLENMRAESLPYSDLLASQGY